MNETVLIEGYASLFGQADLSGDLVEAGAFARSLGARSGDGRGIPGIPMLLQHRGGNVAGSWTRIAEDGRGLFVRGLVSPDAPAGTLALKLMARGLLDGLSIGFIARVWRSRADSGRLLKSLELREISLVTVPMAPNARFAVVSGVQTRAAA